MDSIDEIRKELDAVDLQLVSLFEKRMNLSLKVAEYKIAHGLQVLDSSREQAVLNTRAEMLQDKYWEPYLRLFYQQLMAISRNAQEDLIQGGNGQ